MAIYKAVGHTIPVYQVNVRINLCQSMKMAPKFMFENNRVLAESTTLQILSLSIKAEVVSSDQWYVSLEEVYRRTRPKKKTRHVVPVRPASADGLTRQVDWARLTNVKQTDWFVVQFDWEIVPIDNGNRSTWLTGAQLAALAAVHIVVEAKKYTLFVVMNLNILKGTRTRLGLGFCRGEIVIPLVRDTGQLEREKYTGVS